MHEITHAQTQHILKRLVALTTELDELVTKYPHTEADRCRIAAIQGALCGLGEYAKDYIKGDK